MRHVFLRTLVELAELDLRILLLTGDLGYLVLEPFLLKFPQRVFNVGVAEQNMIGMATGLAEAGFIPFVYSIAAFVTLRPFEFIRNGPVHHHSAVRIVGVGGGFDYGYAGATHFALEDIGLMRSQRGLTVIAPADDRQTRSALLASWELPGPIYYRLGKDDTPDVPGLDGRFTLGRTEQIGEGADMLIIATGTLSTAAVAAAEILADRGVACTVVIAASLNPAPEDDLANLLSRFPAALTVEGHDVVGGLGSLVAEVIVDRQLPCRLARCGTGLTPETGAGSSRYLNELHGLSAGSLAATALRLLN